jgi:hypothetical protein
MRRLLRILFKVTAATCLVACAAVIVLWVRSYWVSDVVNLNRIVRKFAPAEMREAGFLYHSTDVSASRGQVLVYWSEFDGDVIDEGWHYESRPPDDVVEPRGISIWARLGFETYDASGGGVATAPIWPIVLATGLLPCAYLISLGRRRRALRKGLCPVCGYDLRATPDRCPECGAVPSTKGARLPRPGG